MIGIPTKRPQYFLIVMGLYGCVIHPFDSLNILTYLEPGMRFVELHHCIGPAIVAHGIHMGN